MNAFPDLFPTLGSGDIAATLFECSRDCVKLLDEDAKVSLFNRNGMAMMELDSLSQVQGLYWPDLWPPESRTILEKALVEARTNGLASFQAECPTAKGTLKWWDVSIIDLKKGPSRFLVVSRDITSQIKDSQTQRAAFERLNTIMASGTDVLWDIDLLHKKIWWSEGITLAFGYDASQIGDSISWFHEHIHSDDRGRIVASMNDAVMNGETTWEDEFRYRTADGAYLTVFDRGSIIRDSTGKALRFVGIMRDISSWAEATERDKALSGELAHRLNNTLAVISGLFRQSLRDSSDVKQLGETFGNRLIAMAGANTAMIRNRGQGALLNDLAEVQLAPFVGSGSCVIDGPEVALSIETAQGVALALNELATNALKYGALSVPDGRAKLSWRIKDDRFVDMRWCESGGPAVKPPARTGMGTRLIERGIPGAKVTRKFEPSGFICEIQLPRS